MPDSFSGKVCVVTGAAAGMGREMVLQFLDDGAWVFAIDIDREGLGRLKNEAPRDATLVTITADVASEADMRRVADEVHEGASRVDYLVNNAGITLLEETGKVSFAQWRRVLDTNFLGVIHGVHFFYPKMIERGSGRIVNVSSISGSSGYATAQAYATSKAAVTGYTRSLQIEAETHGVDVTLVCPSYIDTGIFTAGAGAGVDKAKLKSTYLVEPVSPEEAAKTVLEGLRAGHKSIVFPFSGCLLYFVSRWMPIFLGPLQRTLLKRFRAISPSGAATSPSEGVLS